MKIKELIERLSNLDENREVILSISSDGAAFSVLDGIGAALYDTMTCETAVSQNENTVPAVILYPI